jgi:hypothetical protein
VKMPFEILILRISFVPEYCRTGRDTQPPFVPVAFLSRITADRFGRIAVHLKRAGTSNWLHWELKSGLGLGEYQVSGGINRSEKSLGIAVLAYLFVLRGCHHVIIPGKPWSIFQLQMEHCPAEDCWQRDLLAADS